MRAGIVSVSTSKAAGEGKDESGPALAGFANTLGLQVADVVLVPDEREQIEAALRRFCDEEHCELVLTTGGTGMAPSDVTPEATRAVIEREAPGIAEAMRLASREFTGNWMLSRNVAGIRGRSLIVNFPGSPRSIGEAGAAISEALPHALKLLAEEPTAH